MYSNRFQTILKDFLKSPAFAEMALGELQSTRCVYQFERPFSIQRVYKLSGAQRSQKVYIKIYKNAYNKSPEKFNATIARDFETNLFWYEKLAQYQEFSTIKPLYYSIPLKAIVTEEAEGKNLGELVAAQLRFRPAAETVELLQTYMHKAGRLLHVLQSFEIEAPPYRLQDLVEDIDSRMREFVRHPRAKFDQGLRQRILAFYEANMEAACARSLRMTYLHRDFMMGNLLVNGETIVVHDFSRIFTGPCLHDLTRFWHHLELLKYKPIYSQAAVSGLQRAFLAGYGMEAGPEDLLFKFFLIRHYITHYKGLLKKEKRPLKARLYNRWVMAKHLERLSALINSETTCPSN